MDTNTDTPPTNENIEKSGGRLSSVEETIECVVNNYSVGDELPIEAKTEVSVSENLLPTDTLISKIPKGNDGSSEDGKITKPMSVLEKMQLSFGFNRLNGPMLDHVIKIIRSLEPDLLPPDDFEVDVDNLQPSTLRELESFVVSIIGEKRYYKKFPTREEQKARVHKKKMRKLEKQLQEDAEISSNQSVDDDDVASNSDSSDSYFNVSSSSVEMNESEFTNMELDVVYETRDQLATSVWPPVGSLKMRDTKQEPDPLETGLPSRSDPFHNK